MGIDIKARSISKNDIRDAIMNNDYSIIKALEKFGFTKDGYVAPQVPVSGGRILLLTVLGFAAVKSSRNELDDKLAFDLIDHIATEVNIFDFVNFMVATFESKTHPEDYANIPYELGEALRENVYSEVVNKIIEHLDPSRFRIMMDYIINSDEVKHLSVIFSVPIIRYIYEHELCPKDMVFSLMVISLRHP